jgi:acyl carrier protein
MERDDILNELKRMVSETIGEDIAEIIGLTAESKFVADLGMDSISLVTFAEKVSRIYGTDTELADWIYRKSVKQLLKLSLGDLADFISSRR